jgi:hypothetical protein
VIIRVHRRIAAALRPKQLIGTVREDLVHVHVVRRAGAGLEDVDDKLIAMLPGNHFIRGADDGLGEARLETPRFLVRQCRGLLDPYRREHEGRKRPQTADREVLGGTHRLYAVQRVGRNVLRA